VAKKGFLLYGQDDKKDEKSEPKGDDGPKDAGEMKKVDLMEKLKGGSIKEQIAAFKGLLECYGVKMGE